MGSFLIDFQVDFDLSGLTVTPAATPTPASVDDVDRCVAVKATLFDSASKTTKNGAYRVLPSFTEFYRVLPSFTEFSSCFVLILAVSICILINVTEIFRI